jgi:hypothetical protein
MSSRPPVLLLPLTMFVNGLEFMVQTLKAMQQVAQQIVIASPNAGAGLQPSAGGGPDRFLPIGGALRGNATTTLKETGEMSDNCNCGNQCGQPFCEVRVYEYYIVSVKPCHEKVVFGPTSIVITSDMSGEAFSSFVTALYCQDHKLSPDDIKYLRVCYRINCSFPKERESCSHGHEQTEILRQIRDAIGGQGAA